MDVIVVLPNTTSETTGALNSMGPGGTNNHKVIYYVLHSYTNTKYHIVPYSTI